MTVDMAHAGWGDPARRTGIPAPARTWLRRTLAPAGPHGSEGPDSPDGAGGPVAVADVRLDPARLPAEARAALVAVVGDAQVTDDHDVRVLHGGGKSYLDLVRARCGEVTAPDAVVLPGSAAEVAAVLAACARHGVAVVPFGGGTSVVGGLTPWPGVHRSVVSLDLRRLDRLVAVDEESLTATLEAGLRGPQAEALLGARGLTLGHFPQSYEHATIGGFTATRSAGQASSGYGRFDDLVVGLVLQTPSGELRIGRGARSAAGPSLLGVALGSEGAFGVITSVTVRVRRSPRTKRYEGFFVREWDEGCVMLRQLAQEGLLPDVARLCDLDETRVQLALAGGGVMKRLGRLVLAARGYRPGCLVVLGWEGTEAGVASRRRAARTVLRSAGAMAAGRSVGDRWARGRFDGPYLRDDLLDEGLLVETLETSATWSQLRRTYDAVRAAIASALPRSVVMCHVSHTYPHGASLYFTVLARRTGDPVAQWQRAKDAASAAIVDSGATITHHHAVGRDHRPWMIDEVGALGVDVLQAVKDALDPAGIMNPGVLIPER